MSATAESWPPPLPVVDPAAITMLREIQEPGEPDVVAETTGIFREDAALRLAEMDDAFGAGDHDRVRRLAHRLKGAALVLGAQRLGRACHGLEQAGAAGSLEDARRWRVRVLEEFDLADEALRRHALSR